MRGGCGSSTFNAERVRIDRIYTAGTRQPEKKIKYVFLLKKLRIFMKNKKIYIIYIILNKILINIKINIIIILILHAGPADYLLYYLYYYFTRGSNMSYF